MTNLSQFRITVLAACGLLGSANAAKPKTIYSFTGGSNGYAPSSLIEVGSTFYGTTPAGGTHNSGTVFQVDAKTHTQKVIYSSQGLAGGPDGIVQGLIGANPSTPLISLNGLLYGATSAGGAASNGTLYQLDPANGTASVLYPFKGESDGSEPNSLLLYNGIFYGTTPSYDGDNCANNVNGGCGTVFSFDPASNTETTLYRFTGGADGLFPSSLVNLGGTIYGVTIYGGNTCGCGTLFQFTPATNTVTTLYTFQGGPTDAKNPTGAPVLVNGIVYGIALSGEACNPNIGLYCGVVYAFNPASGAESEFYSFPAPGGSNGASPSSLLTWNGMLYGATLYGGSTDCFERFGYGTLFQLNPSTAVETTLYVYTLKQAHHTPGYSPSLAIAGSTLYGLTRGTGDTKSDPNGSIFSFTP